MEFCDTCGATMVKVEEQWVCRACTPEQLPETTTPPDRTPAPRPAELSTLPTTDSGSVRKKDAMKWLANLDEPTDHEFRDAFIPKPQGFSGSTYPTSVSNIRLTGDPQFIETIAGLLKPIQNLEGTNTRVEINLQRTEDRETGEETGNYALYLSIAERG